MRAPTSQLMVLLALLILSAAARSEPISIVLSGHIQSLGIPNHPEIPFSDNVLYEINESDGLAAAIPWNQIPANVGDEMRVLLTFDPAASSPIGTYSYCSDGSVRTFGQATGSVTVAGVSAVLTSDSNIVAAGACTDSGFPHQFVSMRSSLDGPSITSTATLTEGPISAEMPIRSIGVELFNSPGSLCVDSEGNIPQTSDEFVSNCGGLPSKSISLIWQSDTFCDIVNCWFHSVFRLYLYGFTLSLPTNNDFVDQLVAEVLVLNLDQGIENSLDAKIADAIGASDNIALAQFATTSEQKTSAKSAAKNKLGAFINEVNAQRGKSIPDAKATRLVTLANNLAARL